jgi:hypothetical protein
MKISILCFLFLSLGPAARNLYLVMKGGYATNHTLTYITFDFK